MQLSGRNFLPELYGEVHDETAPLEGDRDWGKGRRISLKKGEHQEANKETSQKEQGRNLQKQAKKDLDPYLEGREPPLTLRRENQYLHFGHFFPCTRGPFSCSARLFVYHSHRAGPVLQVFGFVPRVGVRHSTSVLRPLLGVRGGCVACDISRPACSAHDGPMERLEDTSEFGRVSLV